MYISTQGHGLITGQFSVSRVRGLVIPTPILRERSTRKYFCTLLDLIITRRADFVNTATLPAFFSFQTRFRFRIGDAANLMMNYTTDARAAVDEISYRVEVLVAGAHEL